MQQIQHLYSHIPENIRIALISTGIIIGSYILGMLLKYFLRKILKAYNHRNQEKVLISSILDHFHKPTRYFFPLLILSFLMPLVPLPAGPYQFMERTVEILLLITFSWVLINTVYVLEDYVTHRYAISKSDNIRERRVLTQLQFVKRIVVLLIIFLTVAMVLMSFSTVRKIGTGLLTSAGIASVIIGFAAQRSIANLLAGLQLAFSQPIRIDDVLVVEGEFGRVEEITFTYVVLRIWDQRRLILPLNYFIEKPFQNWTRSTSEVLGTVFLYTDYTVPVDKVREELKRVVEQDPLWDKRVCVLHVTDSKEKTLELRALVSASDSGSAFDLRCNVREALVRFIQENYPDALPKTRSTMEGPNFTAIPPDVA